MASKGAKAFLIDSSIKRLQANLDKASELIGIEPLVIPTSNRDPEYLMGVQLEAMANWTEALVEHFEASPVVEALDGDTKPNARARVEDGDRDTADADTEPVESIEKRTQDKTSDSDSAAPKARATSRTPGVMPDSLKTPTSKADADKASQSIASKGKR